MKALYYCILLIGVFISSTILTSGIPAMAQVYNIGETSKKIIIAHRGASGYLPEHTLESVTMAYTMGVDFIEQDVVLSKDGVPVILHDIYLDSTTNAREVFPERGRSDGKWYAIDFTLEELKRLNVTERITPETNQAVFVRRFPPGKSDFEIPTLAEEIELIQGLNISTGGQVGLYPELKKPQFHLDAGYDLGNIVLDVLAEYGYSGADANVYIQCFEADYLERLRADTQSELPFVQLISGNRAHDMLVTPEGLDKIAAYADGIGPSMTRIVEFQNDQLMVITDLVDEAHARGLVVHPYTFRKDALPAYARNFEELMRLYYFVIGVDGVFTDFPDVVVKFLSAAGYHQPISD